VNTLAAIIAAAIALPNGNAPAHIRAQEPGYVEHTADMIASAAEVAHVPVLLFAALVVSESALNRDAVSFDGTSLGLAQLNKRGPWYRMWQRACYATPSQCQYAGLVAGATALSDAMRRCVRARDCAVARYRGAWPRVRPIDRRVVLMAQRFAAQMKRKQVLVSWKAGPV
jgi:hypothetical protein